MTDNLSSKIFSEHLNSEFKILLPNSEPLTLRLTEVNERSTAPQQEQFSLYFRGPHTQRLQQQIYRLEHEKIGSLDLFIVPIGVDQEGMQYEVVFNRFRKPESR
jgi:hypothetical protein